MANHLKLRIVRVCGVPSGTRCSLSCSAVGDEDDEKQESGEMVANEKNEATFDWDLSPVPVCEGKNVLRMKITTEGRQVHMLAGLDKFIAAEKKAKCKFDSKDKTMSVVISGKAAVPPPSYWETLLGSKGSASVAEVITALQGDTKFLVALSKVGIPSGDLRIWNQLRMLLEESFGGTIAKRDLTFPSLVAYVEKHVSECAVALLTILIQAEDGSAHPLDVKLATPLGEVMQQCSEELRLKTEDMVFTYSGRLLTDPTVTVDSLGLQDGAALRLRYYIEDVAKAQDLVASLKVAKSAADYENTKLRAAIKIQRDTLSELREEVGACKTQLRQESLTADGVSSVNVLLQEVDYETSRHDIEYAEEMLLIDLESKRDELKHRAQQNANLREHLAYLNESVNECLMPWKGMKEDLNHTEGKVDAIDEMLSIERYTVDMPSDGYIGVELGETADGVISVLSVDINSPADKAGVQEGSVLYSYDSKRVQSLNDLEAAMDAFASKSTPQLLLATGAPTVEDYQRVREAYSAEGPTGAGRCSVM